VPRTPDEAENFKPVLKRKIEMGEEERARLLTGMAGAVTYGTAKLAYDPQGPVAGKTGTCTGSAAKLGLFTSFSSVHQPKLVVTVITTGSGEAGKRAAEIAGKIYRSISHRMLRDSVSAPTAATIEVQPPALKNQE
jgi:cell division protein FtsI/penicillin-binding protein 2